MSGGDTTYSPGGSEVSNCASIFERTILNSPKEIVIKRLRIDDILEVQLFNDGTKKILRVMHPQHGIAGTITSAITFRLIKCIEAEGYTFVAQVKEINNGQCTVIIRPEYGL